MPTKRLVLDKKSHEGTIVLALDGAVDASNHTDFENALKEACEGASPRVVLDCTRLNYLNSRSFGLLYKYQAECAEKGGKLVASGVSRKIKTIISILGLDEYLDTFDTVEGALTDLG